MPFYTPLRRIPSLAAWVDNISCWLHWEDVFLLRECLLQTFHRRAYQTG